MKRANYLRAIGDQLKENAELLGTIETRDTGKIFKETKFQANYIAEYYYYYAGLVDKIEGSTLPIDKEDMHVFTTRVPVGVIARNNTLELANVSQLQSNLLQP